MFALFAPVSFLFLLLGIFSPPQCDVFSLGITLYEIISGRPLPANGEEWHRLRSGQMGMPMGLPADLSRTLQEMMHVSQSPLGTYYRVSSVTSGYQPAIYRGIGVR